MEEEKPNKLTQKIVGSKKTLHVMGSARSDPADITRVDLAQGVALTRPGVKGKSETTNARKLSFYLSSILAGDPR